MLVDDFFQKFIEINVNFDDQKYFIMLSNYQKEQLLHVINSKIDFFKKKYSFQ